MSCDPWREAFEQIPNVSGQLGLWLGGEALMSEKAKNTGERLAVIEGQAALAVQETTKRREPK